MRKNNGFFLAFFVFLLISVLIFGLSKTGILNPLASIFQKIASPVQGLTYNVVNATNFLGTSDKIKKLENENLLLTSMISEQKKLKDNNSALSDQFQTSTPKSTTLIAASIVGAPSFIPGVSPAEYYIIDRGTTDGVKVGQAVVYKDNLVGKITKVNDYLAEVTLVTNSKSSFTVKSSSNALGVVKGQGAGNLILDNVLPSDDLKSSDLVFTNGDTNLTGAGLPPDLVVGKIVAVDKKASSLFQRADVVSFIDFSKITTVFVITK